MSVDYSLIRSFPDQEGSMEEEALLPFGSQDEVIDLLCAVTGFELWKRESFTDTGPWATVTYSYPHRGDSGRSVEFSLQGDPITCISINRAYKEDFLPAINVLSNLSPFEIFDIDGETIKPDELFYSLDDWMRKNYEEGESFFNYQGLDY